MRGHPNHQGIRRCVEFALYGVGGWLPRYSIGRNTLEYLASSKTVFTVCQWPDIPYSLNHPLLLLLLIIGLPWQSLVVVPILHRPTLPG